jgi:hypothetical protein
MAQTGVKAGPRRRLGEVKRGISVTFAKQAAEIFLPQHNFAPKGAKLGEKVGQKRPVAPKNLGILVTWNERRFFGPKFNPVLDFSPPSREGQTFSFSND